MSQANIGMIGLGTMGRNLLLNMAEHGFSGVGYDLDEAKRDLLLEEGKEMPVSAAGSVEELVQQLERPRNIILLVPAGPVVDKVISGLVPHLDRDDLIIDGGNSHFVDTDRRLSDLVTSGIGFMGVGISGGEAGARHGASIMPGGKRADYDRVEPMLRSVAARVDGDPCVAYMGAGSAGHFVKMVHNGIEYGMMQLIAETYDLLKRGFELDDAAISDIFSEWNAGELNGFLIEITSTVLRKLDKETGRPLIEMILDTAGQKGTGKWTSQAAMDLGVPVPTIDAAVTMRQISARRTVREQTAKVLGALPDAITVSSELREGGIDLIRGGLHAAFIATYAQGMALLSAASDEYGYGLDMAEIARIWRGGCIIRSVLLEDIRKTFEADATSENLISSEIFAPILRQKQAMLKAFVHFAMSCDIPCMASAATSNYIRAFATERLPANLIQAQRDYFGAHTYERVDREGVFHTPDWDD